MFWNMSMSLAFAFDWPRGQLEVSLRKIRLAASR